MGKHWQLYMYTRTRNTVNWPHQSSQGSLFLVGWNMIHFDACKGHFAWHGRRFTHPVNAGYMNGIALVIACRRRPVSGIVHLTVAVNPLLLVVDVRWARPVLNRRRWRQSAIFSWHQQVAVVHRLPSTRTRHIEKWKKRGENRLFQIKKSIEAIHKTWDYFRTFSCFDIVIIPPRTRSIGTPGAFLSLYWIVYADQRQDMNIFIASVRTHRSGSFAFTFTVASLFECLILFINWTVTFYTHS